MEAHGFREGFRYDDIVISIHWLGKTPKPWKISGYDHKLFVFYEGNFIFATSRPSVYISLYGLNKNPNVYKHMYPQIIQNPYKCWLFILTLQRISSKIHLFNVKMTSDQVVQDWLIILIITWIPILLTCFSRFWILNSYQKLLKQPSGYGTHPISNILRWLQIPSWWVLLNIYPWSLHTGRVSLGWASGTFHGDPAYKYLQTHNEKYQCNLV